MRLPNGGPQESALGWGVIASGAMRVYGRDNVVYQVAYGNGISRYVNDTAGRGLDAAPRTETDLTLKALPLFATIYRLSALLEQIRPIDCDVWIFAGAEH